MGCNHCMEDAGPNGEHMSVETFEKVMDFTKRIYGHNLLIILSGGEPFEHPQIFELLDRACKEFRAVSILSNGLFVQDTELLRRVRALPENTLIQVTNDPRFYPRIIEPLNLPRVVWEDHIRVISPMGRAVTNHIPSSRISPTCTNLRLLCLQTKNFKQAILYLRSAQKFCIPSIDCHGNILAGESRFCQRIGTVDSSYDELLQNTLSFTCDKCGLMGKL